VFTRRTDAPVKYTNDGAAAPVDVKT